MITLKKLCAGQNFNKILRFDSTHHYNYLYTLFRFPLNLLPRFAKPALPTLKVDDGLVQVFLSKVGPPGIGKV